MAVIITLFVTAFIAICNYKAAKFAQISSDIAAKTIELSIRPVLSFYSIKCLHKIDGAFPILLHFANWGKGAAWINDVHCMSDIGEPIRTDVTTPVCIGPESSHGGVTIFLPEPYKLFALTLEIYYHDSGEKNHKTLGKIRVSWNGIDNPPSFEQIQEIALHDIEVERPPVIQHQRD